MMQTTTMIGDHVVSALAAIGMSRGEVTQREARLDTLLSLLLEMDDDQPIMVSGATPRPESRSDVG